MNDISLWQFAHNSIKQKKKIILMTVADSSLASPGRTGFKMAVNENGKTEGTIGGGIMEKQLVEYSLSLLKGDEKKFVKRLQHSSKTNLEHSGLVCGGFQTIIFSILDRNSLHEIEKLLKNFSDRKDGTLELKHRSFFYNSENKIKDEIVFNYENDENYFYQEKLGFPDTVYIIGGGHVGLAVSEIMKFLGFYVVVFDHRENIFTMVENTFADEKIITEYKNVNKFITPGNRSYAVIVTPMHTGDKDALGSIINMNLKYFGMMGSKKKIQLIFNNLKKDGIDEKLFEKVHSPIGLEINSETPKEIAVSIASEIIKIKNG